MPPHAPRVRQPRTYLLPLLHFTCLLTLATAAPPPAPPAPPAPPLSPPSLLRRNDDSLLLRQAAGDGFDHGFDHGFDLDAIDSASIVSAAPSPSASTAAVAIAADSVALAPPRPTTGEERALERKPWLLFTSAGDHSNVAQWLPGRRYDVMVSYYGDSDDYPWKDAVDIFRRNKDCKFCNIQHARAQEPQLFEKYSAVAVFDDDIQITPDGLNRLFQIREWYDLWITTPAMLPQYHRWYSSLRAEPHESRVRLIPFVEMDCPLFRKDKLWAFLDTFDSSVKGWGTDIWYTEYFGTELLRHQAVVDCVTAINPPTRKDTGKRESLDHLGSDNERRGAWLTIAKERNLPLTKPPKGVNDAGKLSDLSWPCTKRR
jgi:hypothetical protein